MKHSLIQPLWVVLLVCLLALLFDSVLAKLVLAGSAWVVFAAIVSLAPLTDLLDLLLRAARCIRVASPRRIAGAGGDTARGRFALAVSVHNLGADTSAFVKAFADWRDDLWIIDDASDDDTFARLRAAGMNVVQGVVNRKKPRSIQRLLDHIPTEREFIVVLDPDSYFVGEAPRERLEQALERLRDSGAAAFCPAIQVAPDGWLAQFQRIEYGFCFALGRRSLRRQCVLSGLAMFRREDLTHALREHSMSVYAEDLETALLLLGAGRDIYYEPDVVMETEGKREYRAWFSQRVGWFFGLARVHQDELANILRVGRRGWFNFYHFIVASLGFTILLHPVKVFGMLFILLAGLNGLDNLSGLHLIEDHLHNDPVLFLLPYMQYTAIATICTLLLVPGPKLALWPFALLYPVYAVLHMVPVTLGYLNWITVNLHGRRVYDDHYSKTMTIRSARLR